MNKTELTAAIAEKAGMTKKDAAAALEQLGFRKDAVNKVINALISESADNAADTEKLIRAALLRLNF